MTNIKLTIINATEENSAQTAIQQSISFFEQALNCEYKKYSSKETTTLLQNSYSLLNEESLLQLLYDEGKIPRDVYIDTTMKPSYALAAISVWAFNDDNKFFDNPKNIKMFFKLLNACLKFKLEDHGYESEIGKLSNLLVFCKAGVKNLVEQNSPAYQLFTDFFKQEIETLKEKMATHKTTYGEVWFVDDATLSLLDNYEIEGSLYSRQKVTVNSIHGSLDTFVYVYKDNFTGYPVDGRWQHIEKDSIWYACYGSNLSAERFSYYIKGGHYKGKDYTGCEDKTIWQESYWQNIPGKMYFAKQSPRWENGGVSFYAHNAKGTTIMRLYKISRQQLEEIQRQEGRSWYDKILFLGFGYDGYPIYTLTNSKLLLENIPCQSYRSLIETALTEECGLSDETAKTYLNNCHL